MNFTSNDYQNCSVEDGRSNCTSQKHTLITIKKEMSDDHIIQDLPVTHVDFSNVTSVKQENDSSQITLQDINQNSNKMNVNQSEMPQIKNESCEMCKINCLMPLSSLVDEKCLVDRSREVGKFAEIYSKSNCSTVGHKDALYHTYNNYNNHNISDSGNVNQRNIFEAFHQMLFVRGSSEATTKLQLDNLFDIEPVALHALSYIVHDMDDFSLALDLYSDKDSYWLEDIIAKFRKDSGDLCYKLDTESMPFLILNNTDSLNNNFHLHSDVLNGLCNFIHNMDDVDLTSDDISHFSDWLQIYDKGKSVEMPECRVILPKNLELDKLALKLPKKRRRKKNSTAKKSGQKNLNTGILSTSTRCNIMIKRDPELDLMAQNYDYT